MRPVIVRRALTAALAITMLTIPSVSAESVGADGDVVTAGLQDTIDLGTAEPGQAISFNVYFSVACSGTNHVNSGQSVRLVSTPPVIPAGVGYSVPTLTFRLPAGWPADGVPCPEGLAPAVGGPLPIVFTAPPTPGVDYAYRFSWNRIATPSSGADADVFSGPNPTINFILDVGTPRPGQHGTYAGSAGRPHRRGRHDRRCRRCLRGHRDGRGGRGRADGVVQRRRSRRSCPLGTTRSSAQRPTALVIRRPARSRSPSSTRRHRRSSGCRRRRASPRKGPPRRSRTSPRRRSTWSMRRRRSAASPASGSSIPVGDTTVTCTASDASGNSASATFTAHVTYVAPPRLSRRA